MAGRAGDGARLRWTQHLLAALALALVGAGVYANALHVPFMYDDESSILRNPNVRLDALDPDSLAAALEGPAGRPLVYLSFGLNYYFGGYDVRGYHAVNIAIHILNAFLVYLLAIATLQQAWKLAGRAPPPGPRLATAAGFAALVFVTHPIQTQAVTYVVQRMTSLATLFYLLTLVLYVAGRRSRSAAARWTLWAAGGASWALSLASKEIAATLPVALLLYEWFFFQDLDRTWLRRRRGLLAALAGVLVAVSFFYLGTGPLEGTLKGYERYHFSLGERLLTEPRVLVLYLSLLLFPHPARLNLVHEVPLSRSLLDPATTLLSLLALVGLLAVALVRARRWRLLSFAILWFFLQLAIESSFLPLDIVFEHRLYLPMVAVAVAAGAALLRAPPARWGPAVALATVLVALLGTGAAARNRTWRDPIHFWSDSVAKSPGSPRARTNLGVALLRANRADEAASEFYETLRLNPGDPLGLLNLSRALRVAGREAELPELVASVSSVETLSEVLHVAVERGDAAAAARLLAHGADPNARRPPGWTPLHVAAQRGDAAVVALLLEGGADPNAAGPLDVTPLHRAARHGRPRVVQLLLEAGANADAQTQQGDTALDLAVRRRHDGAARLLREADAG